MKTTKELKSFKKLWYSYCFAALIIALSSSVVKLHRHFLRFRGSVY